MPLSTCENIWLQRLVLWQCPFVVFPFQTTLVEDVLAMVSKTMQLHVLLGLARVKIVFASFELWMSSGNIITTKCGCNSLVPIH
jgi:hypothetical protein